MARTQFVLSVLLTLEGAGLVRGLTRGARAVDRFATDVDSRLQRLGRTAADVQLALGAIGVAVENIGKATIDAFAEMELAILTMQSFTKSATRAKEVYEELLDFAARTPIQIEDIIQGTTALLAFEIAAVDTTEAVEDLKEKLLLFGLTAKVMGLPAGMLQVVRALADLKAGVIEIRQLAGLGISRELLSTYGIEFEKSGKLKSAPEEAFQAAMQILENRFGYLAQFVEDTLATKISNIADRIKVIFMRIGEALAPEYRALIEGVYRYLFNLQKVLEDRLWVIQDVAHQIVGAFEPLWKPIVAGLRGLMEVLRDSPMLFTSLTAAVFALVKALVTLYVINRVWALITLLEKGVIALTLAFVRLRLTIVGVGATFAGAGIVTGMRTLLSLISPLGLAIAGVVTALGALVYALHEAEKAHFAEATAIQEAIDFLNEEQRVSAENAAQLEGFLGTYDSFIGKFVELANKVDKTSKEVKEMNVMWDSFRVFLGDKVPASFATFVSESGGVAKALDRLRQFAKEYREELERTLEVQLRLVGQEIENLKAKKEALQKAGPGRPFWGTILEVVAAPAGGPSAEWAEEVSRGAGEKSYQARLDAVQRDLEAAQAQWDVLTKEYLGGEVGARGEGRDIGEEGTGAGSRKDYLAEEARRLRYLESVIKIDEREALLRKTNLQQTEIKVIYAERIRDLYASYVDTVKDLVEKGLVPQEALAEALLDLRSKEVDVQYNIYALEKEIQDTVEERIKAQKEREEKALRERIEATNRLREMEEDLYRLELEATRWRIAQQDLVQESIDRQRRREEILMPFASNIELAERAVEDAKRRLKEIRTQIKIETEEGGARKEILDELEQKLWEAEEGLKDAEAEYAQALMEFSVQLRNTLIEGFWDLGKSIVSGSIGDAISNMFAALGTVIGKKAATTISSAIGGGLKGNILGALGGGIISGLFGWVGKLFKKKDKVDVNIASQSIPLEWKWPSHLLSWLIPKPLLLSGLVRTMQINIHGIQVNRGSSEEVAADAAKQIQSEIAAGLAPIFGS